MKTTGMRALAWAGVIAFALSAWAGQARTVKSRVAPVYPEIAKRMKISGVVKLDVTVDANGKVTDVTTVSGNHTLSSAAEDAVRKWKFATADQPSTESIELKFDLN
jgi:TonB family protein